MSTGRDITNDQIVEKLKEAKGNMTLAAKLLGCTRQMVWKRAKTIQKIQDAIDESREVAVDHAESALQRAVLEGDFRAIAFTLKTLGKDRGYVERMETEVSGRGGVPIKTELDISEEVKKYAHILDGVKK
jgi:hypothetical protein